MPTRQGYVALVAGVTALVMAVMMGLFLVSGLIERERADRLADAPLAPSREPLRLVETPAHLDRTVEESLAHAMRSLDGATLLDQAPDPAERVHLELA